MHRKTVLVMALAGLTGACGGGGFSGNDVAAKASGQEFKAERLATILTTAKGARLTPESADFIANLWVDYTLFAQGVASGDFKVDSATIVASMWPVLADMRASHWRDTLIARRAKASDAQVDSTYNAGNDRALQHILIMVAPTAKPDERAAARKKIDAIAAQLKGGAVFGAVALKGSADPQSAADSGYLPIGPRGRFVPQFDSVGYSLKPGETSGVVPTQFGFHIIRRPSLDEARRRYVDFVRESQMTAIETTYFNELDKKNDFKISGDAGAKIKAALADLEGKKNDKSNLVSFKNGGFTVADFVRWVRAITADPVQGGQTLAQIKAAPDTQLVEFTRRLAQNTLVLRDADSAKVQITADEWKKVQGNFNEQVDSLKVAVGLGPDAIDPKASAEERAKAAALKVDQYFDKLVGGQTRLRVLPGLLAIELRSKGKYGVNPAGTKRGLELAQAKAGPDTTKAPAGLMQPAPGGAPVPGAESPAPSTATPSAAPSPAPAKP